MGLDASHWVWSCFPCWTIRPMHASQPMALVPMFVPLLFPPKDGPERCPGQFNMWWIMFGTQSKGTKWLPHLLFSLQLPVFPHGIKPPNPTPTAIFPISHGNENTRTRTRNLEAFVVKNGTGNGTVKNQHPFKQVSGSLANKNRQICWVIGRVCTRSKKPGVQWAKESPPYGVGSREEKEKEEEEEVEEEEKERVGDTTTTSKLWMHDQQWWRTVETGIKKNISVVKGRSTW